MPKNVKKKHIFNKFFSAKTQMSCLKMHTLEVLSIKKYHKALMKMHLQIYTGCKHQV